MGKVNRYFWFQLTAARRRLAKPPTGGHPNQGFNSQPPEGGWKRGAVGRGG